MVKFFLIATLLTIAFQDFRERLVLLWVMLLALAAALYYHALANTAIAWSYVGVNAVVVLLLLTGIWAYGKYKLKIKFEEGFGFGDVLFFVVMVLLYAPFQFLMVVNVTLLVSAVLGLLLPSFKSKGVPLAGIQALGVLIYFGLEALQLVPNAYVRIEL